MFGLAKVTGAQTCIGDDDSFGFEIVPGKNKQIVQFGKNVGTYAMKFYKMNNK